MLDEIFIDWIEKFEGIRQKDKHEVDYILSRKSFCLEFWDAFAEYARDNDYLFEYIKEQIEHCRRSKNI